MQLEVQAARVQVDETGPRIKLEEGRKWKPQAYTVSRSGAKPSAVG